MDLSLGNSINHIKKLWVGETESNESEHQERGDYSFDKDLDANTTEVETDTAAVLDTVPVEYFISNPTYNKDPPQSQRTIEDQLVNLKVNPTLHSDPLFGQYSLCRIIMASIVGTYQHVRNENLDDYFKALEVPFVPRKLMVAASPRLEITQDGDKWTIRTVSLMRTTQLTFTLGVEYEESMPSGETLKNVTTMEGNNLITVSVTQDNNKIIRKYECNEDTVILTMSHEKTGQVAKRYFKRLS